MSAAARLFEVYRFDEFDKIESSQECDSIGRSQIRGTKSDLGDTE